MSSLCLHQLFAHRDKPAMVPLVQAIGLSRFLFVYLFLGNSNLFVCCFKLGRKLSVLF